MPAYKTIGFIGLGVMGEPICRNLVKKSGAGVIVFDLAPEPLARLHAEGAAVAGSVAEIVSKSDIVFLCLPSAKHARAVFSGDCIKTGEYGKKAECSTKLAPDPEVTVTYECEKGFTCSGPNVTP